MFLLAFARAILARRASAEIGIMDTQTACRSLSCASGRFWHGSLASSLRRSPTFVTKAQRLHNVKQSCTSVKTTRLWSSVTPVTFANQETLRLSGPLAYHVPTQLCLAPGHCRNGR